MFFSDTTILPILPLLSIYNLFVIHHSSNCPHWLDSVFHIFYFSDSFTCTPTFICHPVYTPRIPTYSPTMCFFPSCPLLPFPPSEESDYHTDYEEEALESALSDLELYNRYGEHTEGEETGDTVRLTGSMGFLLFNSSVAITFFFLGLKQVHQSVHVQVLFLKSRPWESQKCLVGTYTKRDYKVHPGARPMHAFKSDQ